jgi:hypothetical protein
MPEKSVTLRDYAKMKRGVETLRYRNRGERNPLREAGRGNDGRSIAPVVVVVMSMMLRMVVAFVGGCPPTFLFIQTFRPDVKVSQKKFRTDKYWCSNGDQ